MPRAKEILPKANRILSRAKRTLLAAKRTWRRANSVLPHAKPILPPTRWILSAARFKLTLVKSNPSMTSGLTAKEEFLHCLCNGDNESQSFFFTGVTMLAFYPVPGGRYAPDRLRRSALGDKRREAEPNEPRSHRWSLCCRMTSSLRLATGRAPQDIGGERKQPGQPTKAELLGWSQFRAA